MTDYLLMMIIALLISESSIWGSVWQYARFAKFRKNWKRDYKRKISRIKDWFKNLLKKDSKDGR